MHGAQIIEANRAIVLRLDDRLLEGLAGGAADMKRPHGQLRARLADRLCGDDADCFAKFDKLASREIASVAHGANAAAAFTSQHRANLELLHTDALKFRGDLFINELIRFDDFLFLFHRVRNRLATDAADNACGKIDNFLVALVNRAHNDAVYSPAICLVDNHVLRRIDQLAGEITGVRRFERGVSQTLARAVGGDEVLQHAKSLAKVRSDWVLENFTGRLRHQSTHAGELTHLLTITARSGIDHQIHRIQFLASLVVFESPEHDAGNFVSSVRPDVDNLVVTLAVRDNAFAILLLDLPDLLVSIFELSLFLLRNNHVRNSNRETGLGRFGEPKLL